MVSCHNHRASLFLFIYFLFLYFFNFQIRCASGSRLWINSLKFRVCCFCSSTFDCSSRDREPSVVTVINSALGNVRKDFVGYILSYWQHSVLDHGWDSRKYRTNLNFEQFVNIFHSDVHLIRKLEKERKINKLWLNFLKFFNLYIWEWSNRSVAEIFIWNFDLFDRYVSQLN